MAREKKLPHGKQIDKSSLVNTWRVIDGNIYCSGDCNIQSGFR